MAKHIVGSAADIENGGRLLVELEGKDIGIFNVDGEFYAYVSWCAHQGGPCCEGCLEGTLESTFDRETLETTLEFVRKNEMLCCPWHGWEYDVKTGKCRSQQGYQLPSYEVSVKDGDLVVHV